MMGWGRAIPFFSKTAGAIFGGEIKFKKGSFLRGQLDAGTALGGKVELGHSFDLGKNMGLELSGKAQCSSSLTEKKSFTYASAVESAYYVDIKMKPKHMLHQQYLQI